MNKWFLYKGEIGFKWYNIKFSWLETSCQQKKGFIVPVPSVQHKEVTNVFFKCYIKNKQ